MIKIFFFTGLMLSSLSAIADAYSYPSYGGVLGGGYQQGYPQQMGYSMEQPSYSNNEQVMNSEQNFETKKSRDAANVDKAAVLLKQELGINPNEQAELKNKVKLSPEQIKEQKEKIALIKIDRKNDKSLDKVFVETYPSILHYPEEISLKDY